MRYRFSLKVGIGATLVFMLGGYDASACADVYQLAAASCTIKSRQLCRFITLRSPVRVISLFSVPGNKKNQ